MVYLYLGVLSTFVNIPKECYKKIKFINVQSVL